MWQGRRRAVWRQLSGPPWERSAVLGELTVSEWELWWLRLLPRLRWMRTGGTMMTSQQENIMHSRYFAASFLQKNPQRTPRWSVICDFIVWTTFYPSSVRIVFIIAKNWIAWYVGSLWHVPYHWPFPQPNNLPSITFGPFYRICALAWGHNDMQTLSTLLTLCRSTSLSLGDFLNKIQ